MADDNKTEQATDQRRKKAREDGQVTRSRELAATSAMLAGVLVLVAQGPANLTLWRQFFRVVLDQATHSELSLATPLLPWAAELVFRWIWKPLASAWGVAVLVSLAQGGIIFVPKLLVPDINKLNPSKKISQMFGVTTLVQVFKALVPSSAIVFIGINIFRREWSTLGLGLWASPRQISSHLFTIVFEVFWKSSFVLLCWAVLDYIVMRQKSERDLRMSKQEIREEMKQDGNPATKSRIRRLQRQSRRRRMLQDTKKATVVITNPTHYAVALEYRDDMGAPTVVAKGQNLVAQQIKEIARWDGIPIIENAPLAQSLYKTVEVGQAIPEKLYAAVAEILAYIFRMNAEQAARRKS